jgi:hypothetical protein
MEICKIILVEIVMKCKFMTLCYSFLYPFVKPHILHRYADLIVREGFIHIYITFFIFDKVCVWL